MTARLSFRRLEPDAEDGGDPLVVLIADALAHLGGAAHRSLVLTRVASVMGRVGPLSPDGAAQVIAAFERRVGEGSDDPRPFRLPFGPQSHRWALKGTPQPRPAPSVIDGWRWRRRDAAALPDAD